MRKSPSDRSVYQYSFAEVLPRMEAYCAYQDRCESEVRLKMASFGLSANENDEIIKHLFEKRFLDEERFVESFVFGKFRIKKWGRNKIKAELRNKGLSGEIVKRFLDKLSGDDYTDTIRVLIEKKYQQLKEGEDEYSKKVKIIRFVASKGFELDLIQDAYHEFRLKHD